jgi:hypothetical protein
MSRLAEARRWPSGMKATLIRARSCPLRGPPIAAPVAAS